MNDTPDILLDFNERVKEINNKKKVSINKKSIENLLQELDNIQYESFAHLKNIRATIINNSVMDCKSDTNGNFDLDKLSIIRKSYPYTFIIEAQCYYDDVRLSNMNQKVVKQSRKVLVKEHGVSFSDVLEKGLARWIMIKTDFDNLTFEDFIKSVYKRDVEKRGYEASFEDWKIDKTELNLDILYKQRIIISGKKDKETGKWIGGVWKKYPQGIEKTKISEMNGVRSKNECKERRTYLKQMKEKYGSIRNYYNEKYGSDILSKKRVFN